MASREPKLVSLKDWDAWITVIKGKAITYDVWDLINPENDVKPALLSRPKEPDPIAGTPTMESIAIHAYYHKEYKSKIAAWKEQKESISKINEYIFTTTAATNLKTIQKTEPSPWDLLRALKLRLTPSDSARCIELETEYHRLQEGPGNRQNPEAWIEEWRNNYDLARQHRIAEVMDIKRAYRDFLQALGKVAPILPPVHQYAVTKCTTEAEEQKQLHEVEGIARHYFRDLEANKKHYHAAFPAQGDRKNDQQGQQDQQKDKGKTSFQGEDIKIPTCICGKLLRSQMQTLTTATASLAVTIKCG